MEQQSKIVGPVSEDTLPYRHYLTEYHDNGEVVVDKVLARSWVEAEEIAEANGEVVVGLHLQPLSADGNPLTA